MTVEVATDYPMLIDGERVQSLSGAWLDVHSPATGELVGRVPAGVEPMWIMPLSPPDAPFGTVAGPGCSSPTGCASWSGSRS